MTTPADGTEPENSKAWEDLLRELLGPEADELLHRMSEGGGDLTGIPVPGLTGPDGEPLDLAAMAAAAGLPNDPAALAQVLGRIRGMLDASGDGPVNWDLARDIARQGAVAEGDPTVSAVQDRDVAAAFSTADLWLDTATDLPPGGGPARAWSRSEWVEGTSERWRTITEPVAGSVVDALAAALSSQAPEMLAEMGPDASNLGGRMMRQLGGAVFGMQVGQATGALAQEVFGSTDTGVPLIDSGTALVPRNVEEFAEGLDVPAEELLLFLALREAAHARLFTHVPWLRGHLIGAVEAYGRGISIDKDSLEDAVASIDATDPQAIQQALSSGVFALETTPEQDAALLRLETALALVEGWVDEVTAAAAEPHLPNTGALREMLRRRRAAGGPAENIFATLVGLELRPRRSRDAARLWAQIAADGGTGARDAVWDHPDLLPGPEDLDDPSGYAARRLAVTAEHADVDRALAEIFGSDDETPSTDDAPRDTTPEDETPSGPDDAPPATTEDETPSG